MQEALTRIPPRITQRQLQVIELIAAGCSNQEVGERLGISPRTAKAHCDVLRRSSALPGVGRSRSLTGSSPGKTHFPEASGRSPSARGTDGAAPASRDAGADPLSDSRNRSTSRLASCHPWL